MTTIAELGFAINSEPAAQAADDLDRLVQSGAKAEQSVESLATASKQAEDRMLALARAALQSSSYQETLNRAYESTAGEAAAAARAQLDLAASQSRTAKSTSDAAAGQDRLAASEKKVAAASTEQAQALAKLLGQIDPTVAAYARLDAQQQQLAKFKAAGILPADDFSRYNSQIESTRQKLGGFDDALQKTGKTSTQTREALRQLPSQFTDIFTSLAGGQNPLLVLIQQGGQIKDSFGGIGPMFDALGEKFGSMLGFTSGAAALGDAVGSIGSGAKAAADGADAAGDSIGNLAEGANTAADASKNAAEAAGALRTAASGVGAGMGAVVGLVTTLVAALAALGLAYKQGSAEASSYNKALILTGNSAGTSAGKLSDIAKAVANVNGTVHEAAASLAQLAGSTRIPVSAFEMIAVAAANMEDATGKATSETVSNFEKLAKEPLKASIEFTESLNYLTAATYEQIAALERQGDTQGAAQVAWTSYAEAIGSRSKQITANLGLLESTWKDVTDAAKGAWDAMRDVGRDQSIDEQIANTQKMLENRKTGWLSGLFEDSESTRFLQDRLKILEKARDSQAASVKEEGRLAQARREGNEAYQGYLKDELAARSKVQKMNDALEAKQRQITDARAAGFKITAEQEEAAYKAIREDSAYKEAAAKKEQAYTEAAGIRALDQAKQQEAVLNEQLKLVGLQKGEVDKLGESGKALIKWEQELADLKEKKTLTADQKSLLANQEQITAQLTRNAGIEKEIALKKLSAEEDEKLLTYQKAINAELDLAQQGLSNQLAGLGLGQEGRKRLQDDLKIRQDYQKKLNALQEQLNEGRLTKATYEKETALLADALDKRLSMQQDYYRQLELAQADWSNGATAAWQDYVDSAADISSQTYDLFSNAFGGMEDALVDFVTSGKLSFKSLADSIIADIARIVIRTKIVTPALNALFGGSGAGGGASSLLGGGSTGGGFNLESAWNTASGAYSVATSGFGQAVSAGWSAGEGFLGGLQGAFKAGAGSISAGIGSLFAGSGGSMVNGVYQLGSSGSVATVDLISNTVTNSATGAVTGTASGATSAAGAGLSGASALMAGIGGAIQGYLKAGVKGAVAGAGGAVAGAYAGAAIGSVIPVIGTAIGGAIGAVVGGLFGSSLFGGDWVTKDQGFQLGVTDGDLDAYAFEYQKKKGGLFSSNKKRTRLTALDPEMQAALDGTYATTLGTVLGLFESLNVELNDGVLDGLNMAATQISTKDKTAEEIQAEIAKWFTSLGDAAVDTVAKATNELSLSGYSLDQLSLSVSTLLQLNSILEKTNNGMLAVSVGGLHLAERLAELGGGMERFSELTSGYYNAFIPAAERADDTLIDVGRQFQAMNIAFPATREGFRTLVEALDVTTLSGQDAYVSLMNLAAGADAAYTILEDRAAAAAESAQALFDTLVGAAGTAQSAVQRAIAAEQEKATAAYNARIASLNDMSSTASKSVTDLTGVSNSLSNALKALRGDSGDAVKMLQAQARATLQSALATARSGGSLAGFAGLDEALSTVSSNNTDLYGSMEDFARDQGRTANVVAELNAINGKQLTTAEKTVKALQEQIDQAKAAYDAQMAQYDQQLEFAQAQMDALNGVDNSVKSVADAVREMNAAVVAAIGSIGGKSTPENSGTLIDTIYKDVLGRDADAAGKQYWQGQLANGSLNNGNIVGAIKNSAAIEAAYQAVLGRTADAGGAAYWAGQLSSGALTPAQLQQAIKNAAVANGQVPAFATGGDHLGGLRLVGENGPELEVTGPSRIFNANQTAAMLKGGSGSNEELLAEVRQLRQENRQAQFQLVKYGKEMALMLDRWNNEGTPKERDYA